MRNRPDSGIAELRRASWCMADSTAARASAFARSRIGPWSARADPVPRFDGQWPRRLSQGSGRAALRADDRWSVATSRLHHRAGIIAADGQRLQLRWAWLAVTGLQLIPRALRGCGALAAGRVRHFIPYPARDYGCLDSAQHAHPHAAGLRGVGSELAEASAESVGGGDPTMFDACRCDRGEATGRWPSESDAGMVNPCR